MNPRPGDIVYVRPEYDVPDEVEELAGYERPNPELCKRVVIRRGDGQMGVSPVWYSEPDNERDPSMTFAYSLEGMTVYATLYEAVRAAAQFERQYAARCAALAEWLEAEAARLKDS